MAQPSRIALLSLSIFLTWTFTVAQSIGSVPIVDILCDTASLPEICPAIYEPVCIPEPKTCITTPCFQTVQAPNSCEACKTPVQSYRIGKCQYLCEGINLPPPALDTRNDPVCANYQENCQDEACRNTFMRSTSACQDLGVVSFTLGPCPEDEVNFADCGESGECSLEEEYSLEEGEEYNVEEEVLPDEPTPPIIPTEAVVPCLDPRPEVCPEVSNPVCVNACLDNQCRYTVGNSCNACADPNVISYTPGPCEVQRIPCQPPNAPPIDSVCLDPLDPVCAYSFNCTEEPCGVTTGNSCEACDLLQSDYYILGSCL